MINMLGELLSKPPIDSCSLLIILFLIPITWYIWKRLTNKLPPGPTPLPLIGNYFTFSKDVTVYEQLRQLAGKYPNVMTVYFGPMPFVVLNNFEAVKEAFVNQANDFAGRPFSVWGEIFSEGSNDILMSDFGPRWTLHRKLAMAALKKFGDKNTISNLISENTWEACELMLKEHERCGVVGEVKQKMYLLIYNVIASIVFGKKFSHDDQDFKMLMKNMDDVNESFGKGFIGDYIPKLSFLPTPAKSVLQSNMNKILEFFRENIAEHENSLDANNPRDITDHVLITRAEMEREGKEDMSMFTNTNLRQTLSDIFLAGTDATCFTLTWTILYCIYYPKEQQKVYEEIESIVGTRMVTMEDKRQLNYTEAFLLEAMRLRPIVPLSVTHATTASSAKLYEYTVHKGVNVVPNIWACHHDPKYWDDPEAFKPERFIDTKTGKVNTKPDSFLPFSLGKRGCAGEHLARIDNFLIFATLIQKLKFSKVNEKRSIEEALAPDVAMGYMVCMPHDFEIKVASR